MDKKFHYLYGLIIVFLAITLVYFYQVYKAASPRVENPLPTVHWHADLKVVVNGQTYNFDQDRFMHETDNKNDAVHFHNHDGDVVHVHKFGVTWGDLFQSVGGALTKDCLALPNFQKSCSNNSSDVSGNFGILKTFVNGQVVNNLYKQSILDLEKVLIYFGPPLPDEQILTSPTKAPTSKSCIYSEFCPRPAGWKETSENCTANKPCH